MINFSFLFLRVYVFFKRKIFGKIIMYTEETSIECKSCKKQFMHNIFHWRQPENQSKCSLCNSEDNSNFFCNVCKTEPCNIEEEYFHIDCDFCDKTLGVLIDNEPDLSPCSRCGYDVFTPGSEIETVCNLCRSKIK